MTEIYRFERGKVPDGAQKRINSFLGGVIDQIALRGPFVHGQLRTQILRKSRLPGALLPR